MKNLIFILLMLVCINAYATTYEITTPGNNLGIGSASPGQALDVNGTVRATNFIINGGSIQSASPGDIALNPTANNVGVGTSLPIQKLDVKGTVRMTGFTLTTSPTNGYVLTSDANGVGTWASGGSGLWTTINTNDVYETNGATKGNVGIGTSLTTNNALTVLGSVSVGTTAAATANGLQVLGNVSIGTGTTSNNALTIYAPAGNSNVSIGTSAAAGGTLQVGTGVTTCTGNACFQANVGIGSTNPQYALDIGTGVGIRAIGIGTTVPQQLCRTATGAIGYFNGAWASSCTAPSS